MESFSWIVFLLDFKVFFKLVFWEDIWDLSVKDEMILRLVVFLFMGWICRVNGKNMKGLKKIVKVEYVCWYSYLVI